MQYNLELITPHAMKVLESFLSGLSADIESRLDAVVVTGEATLPEFVAGRSALELMVLAETIDNRLLDLVGRASRPYFRKGFMPPLILTRAELESSLDAFPLEFLSIKATGIVVAGECDLAALKINRADLRVHCERELRGLLLHARMAAIRSGERAVELGRMLAAGSGKLITVLRGLEVLAGGDGTGSVTQLVSRLEERELADGELLQSLLSRRFDKKPEVTEKQWASLSAQLRKLVEWVDRQ